MNFRQHLAAIRNGDAAKTTGPKPKKPIARVSKKKRAEIKADQEARNGDDTALVKWFKSQMKYMPSRCEETGEPINNREYRFAICSIAHILPKENCVSVKLHPLNRVFLHPDFHTKFDAMSWEEREKLKIWPKIQERLISVWPDLSPEEHRHFPESVRNWIEENNPF